MRVLSKRPLAVRAFAILIAGVSLASEDGARAMVGGQDPQRGGGRGAQRGGSGQRSGAKVLDARVPDHPADVILARPTADSITLSVMVSRSARAVVAYGTSGGALSGRTDTVTLDPDTPRSIVLGGLRPNTRYLYEVRRADAAAGEAALIAGSFRTARPPGSGPFVFTITADSHLDDRVDPAVYERTLTAARGDGPDFHVDLGDTFMTERHPDRSSAARQYVAQRYYFGLLARAAPLFLVLGNHDGEGRRFAGGADSLAVWANDMRTRHFPNPVPDAFYTGNASRDPDAGLLENYYSWRWGDARLIVLDPFWPSNRRGGDDGWAWTLGEEQYRWLARTLAQNDARFTFVFIHHLVGGDQQARGGIEASTRFEWGGANADGSPGFASHRPGWGLPIHDLLVKHRVSAVFHGHDHLYAREQRDGLTYQEVPQPGDARGGSDRAAGGYGYRSGTVLGGTGYLRVKVAPEAAAVEFVDVGSKASPPRVADRYVMQPAR